MSELHFFDRTQEVTVVERRLPHWTQPGVVCFITLRTNDSIPRSVLLRWRREKETWLLRHQINPRADNWKDQLSQLDRSKKDEFYRTFSEKWHRELDNCHGACVLRRRDLAGIVSGSLMFAADQKYVLTDFIVMPNHVHLLAAFPTEDGMLAQCTSWKRFTATGINRLLGRKGRFWQQDGFDHLVRSEEQFRYFQRYIVENPRKARLKTGNYLHFSAR